MEDQGFAATVVRHLEPVLGPRGFPSQDPTRNDGSVLFHCDGPEVERVLDRHPAWRTSLRESYGEQPIPCLDLWVQQDDGVRAWSFEIFGSEVAAVAGARALQRLEDLQEASLDAWAAQLASILDAYFVNLEGDGVQPEG